MFRVATEPRLRPPIVTDPPASRLVTTRRQRPKRVHWLCWVGGICVVGGCERHDPPGGGELGRATTAQVREDTIPRPVDGAPREKVQQLAPSDASAPAALGVAGAPNAPTRPAHSGPWLTVLSPSTAIYAEANAERANKLGYAQSGARLPVTGKAKPSEKCASGWVEVSPSGFVCTAAGTLDDKEPRIKFTLKPPAIDNVLPHVYARNGKNGTPLYRSIPTRGQMLEYEPYLRKPDRTTAGCAAGTVEPTPVAATSATTSLSVVAAPSSAPSPEGSNQPAAGSEDGPWWQQDGIEDRLHEIRLSDLQKDSDDVLALRMVKGFYVAVDKAFHWNGRLWYKTTKGLVAPADRMGQAAPSEFKGVELGSEWHLPLGWTYGGREKTTTYEIESDKGQVKPSGTLSLFQSVQLTERSVDIKGTVYRELASGKWVKQAHVRITEPGEPPKELGEKERWVDVDRSTQ